MPLTRKNCEFSSKVRQGIDQYSFPEQGSCSLFMFEAFTFAGEASEHQTALSNGNSEVFERARERKDKYI